MKTKQDDVLRRTRLCPHQFDPLIITHGKGDEIALALMFFCWNFTTIPSAIPTHVNARHAHGPHK